MTIALTDTSREFSTNGSTAVFSLAGIVYKDDSHIKAVHHDTSAKVSTTLVLTADYTLSGIGDSGAGVLTTTSPLATGYLEVWRDSGGTQTQAFTESGGNPASQLEAGLDDVMLKAQEAAGIRATTLHRARGDLAVAMELPLSADRQGKLLKFDAGGAPAVGPPADLIEDAINEALGNFSLQNLEKVSTRAAMTALLISGLHDGDRIFNLAYATQGDKGQAVFEWRAASTATVTGVTVFAADEGGTGRWHLLSGDLIFSAVAGVKHDNSTDDTAALQRLVNASPHVVISGGACKITDAIDVPSSCRVTVAAGCQINQITDNKPCFRLTSAIGTTIDGDGILYGAGNYDNAWSSNGHFDRGIDMYACKYCTVRGLNIRNWAHAGVAMTGGDHNTIEDSVTIEGTHAYSQTINAGSNFQMGVFATHDATHGEIKYLTISAKISGTAQGVVLQGYSGFTGTSRTNLINPNIHDIAGQHGIYAQTHVNINGGTIDGTALNSIKIQSGTPNQAIRGCIVSGVTCSNALDAALAIQTTGTGSIENGYYQIIAIDCQRGVSVEKNVRSSSVYVVAYNSTQHALVLSGDNLSDLECHVQSNGSGRAGILVDATNSSGIRLYPIIRKANSTAGLHSGISVASATATVDMYDADITDSGSNMLYGIISENSGALVGIHGTLKVSGYATNGVRSVDDFTAFPSNPTYGDDATAYFDLGNIGSVGTPVTVVSQSTSTANVTGWKCNLEDESTYLLTAEGIGKLSGSGERVGFKKCATFYRDGGGGATLQGAVGILYNEPSAGYAGTYNWAASGNTARFYLTSGGAAVYDWTVKYTVVKLSD